MTGCLVILLTSLNLAEFARIDRCVRQTSSRGPASIMQSGNSRHCDFAPREARRALRLVLLEHDHVARAQRETGCSAVVVDDGIVGETNAFELRKLAEHEDARLVGIVVGTTRLRDGFD